ncbi:MAG: hypothetical protein MJE68_13225 [Proteobacteria bacterium]|nr:hypothetical protein [Pseudomonadota bacterium]
MGSITLDELLATRPKRVREAVRHESIKLEAKLLLKHGEADREELLSSLSHERREAVVAEMARLQAKRQAKQAKVVKTTTTSDSLESTPVPLSAKGK